MDVEGGQRVVEDFLARNVKRSGTRQAGEGSQINESCPFSSLQIRELAAMEFMKGIT